MFLVEFYPCLAINKYYLITDESLCSSSPVFDPENVVVAALDPRIYVYENFLSEEECEYIIELGNKQGLSRSEVAASDNNSKSEARTSYGTFLEPNDPILQRIEQRIAVWSQIPQDHGEPFYLLRYSIGQEYKPHWDYFDPKLPGMDRYIGKSGQRTATVLIYLHTPVSGGETTFPKSDILVPAVQGTAVLFWSHTNDHKLDGNSLHGSLPVKEGIKYCCTKWIRENKWN